MIFFTFTKLGRTLSLTAALSLAAVAWLGCGGNPSGGGGGGGGIVDPNTVVKGTFVDRRDGQTYNTVKIGGKTWMAENMNIDTADSWCFGGSPDSCAKYGRLYVWNAAKTACPKGWHLSTRDEWDRLAMSVGGTRAPHEETYRFWLDAGKKLKAKSGWESRSQGVSVNGTDSYGLFASPRFPQCFQRFHAITHYKVATPPRTSLFFAGFTRFFPFLFKP